MNHIAISLSPPQAWHLSVYQCSLRNVDSSNDNLIKSMSLHTYAKSSNIPTQRVPRSNSVMLWCISSFFDGFARILILPWLSPVKYASTYMSLSFLIPCVLDIHFSRSCICICPPTRYLDFKGTPEGCRNFIPAMDPQSGHCSGGTLPALFPTAAAATTELLSVLILTNCLVIEDGCPSVVLYVG